MLHITQRIGQRYVRIILASVGRGTFMFAIIFLLYIVFNKMQNYKTISVLVFVVKVVKEVIANKLARS